MSKKVITIKDIAKELDISVATVSRALRGSTEIKRETKLAVLQMAKELDYHPNLLASSLSSKRSKIIGVVVPTINRQFWSNSISGIEKIAFEHDYKVMIFQSSESAASGWQRLFAARESVRSRRAAVEIVSHVEFLGFLDGSGAS